LDRRACSQGKHVDGPPFLGSLLKAVNKDYGTSETVLALIEGKMDKIQSLQDEEIRRAFCGIHFIISFEYLGSVDRPSVPQRIDTALQTHYHHFTGPASFFHYYNG